VVCLWCICGEEEREGKKDGGRTVQWFRVWIGEIELQLLKLKMKTKTKMKKKRKKKDTLN
jgi:hypothetical protein